MSTRRWARLSLVLLWWGTVAASLHDGGAAGQALLQQATGMGAGAALALVLLGCAWDAAIGLWLPLCPRLPRRRPRQGGHDASDQPTLWACDPPP